MGLQSNHRSRQHLGRPLCSSLKCFPFFFFFFPKLFGTPLSCWVTGLEFLFVCFKQNGIVIVQQHCSGMQTAFAGCLQLCIYKVSVFLKQRSVIMLSGHYCICVTVGSEPADKQTSISPHSRQQHWLSHPRGYGRWARVLPPCPGRPADQGFLSQVFPVQTGSGAWFSATSN